MRKSAMIKLATRKGNPLVKIAIWCFNRLSPANKVDLTCALIRYIEADEECQHIIYISCGRCPDKVGKAEGIRRLGLPEKIWNQQSSCRNK